MKKILCLIFSAFLLLSITTGCGCSKKNIKKDKKIKVNTNEDVIKDQQLEVFTFTNTSLVYEDSTSILTTVVTNTSEKTEYLKEFKINVKDKDGNVIVVLTGFVGDNIEAKSSMVITSSYGEDLTKAASIDYEVVR